jgi:sugar phosphate isomerase/epimerase
MASNRVESRWNRRQILAAGAAFGATLGLGRSPLAAASMADDGVYSPFKLGLQSYSLRGLTDGGRPDRKKALEATKELGLHYWEAFPAHFPQTTDSAALEKAKAEMATQGVTLSGWGVVGLGKDPAADERVFEFARAAGLDYLSADPAPDGLDSVDKLIEKFGIPIGIHNHGPGHQYAKIETIEKTIKDHHPKLGVCIDTGHFLRSRVDPVDAANAFAGRVFGVHLKDVKNAETFTILGKGDLRTVDFLKALLKQKYSYLVAIEYEENPESPQADIKECLAAAAKAVAEARGA